MHFKQWSDGDEPVEGCSSYAENMTAGCERSLKYSKDLAVHLPDGRDYGHLVAHSSTWLRESFEEMLSEYDRVLLQFGLRIVADSAVLPNTQR